MGSVYICLVAVSLIVICESLPVYKTEIDNGRKNNKFNEFLNEFVSEVGHNIVRRSKRNGIINGHLCPIGTGKLSTGDCVPCNGYVYCNVPSD